MEAHAVLAVRLGHAIDQGLLRAVELRVAGIGNRPLPVCADGVFANEAGGEHNRDALVRCMFEPVELSDVNVHRSRGRENVVGKPRKELARRLGRQVNVGKICRRQGNLSHSKSSQAR